MCSTLKKEGNCILQYLLSNMPNELAERTHYFCSQAGCILFLGYQNDCWCKSIPKSAQAETGRLGWELEPEHHRFWFETIPWITSPLMMDRAWGSSRLQLNNTGKESQSSSQWPASHVTEVRCRGREQDIKGQYASVSYLGSEKIHSGNKTGFYPMEYECSYHTSKSALLQDTKESSWVRLSAILNYQSRFSELSKLRTSSATLYAVIHWVIHQIVKYQGGCAFHYL